jgi:hypothetical protein
MSSEQHTNIDIRVPKLSWASIKDVQATGEFFIPQKVLF